MVSREDIISEVENELDNMLTEAPKSLSEKVRQEIKVEFVGYTEHVLNSVTSEELQSPFALDRFVETTLAHARMRLHLR